MNSNRDRARSRLFTKYPSEKVAVWEVRGEDSNADLAGPHRQPVLGFYEGKYYDVVDFALDMPGFFAWGYGGDVREVKIEAITESKARQMKDARRELKELEKRRDELNKKVEWLTLGGSAK